MYQNKGIELIPASQFTPDEQRVIWKDLENHYPVLWKKCYPKIYHSYKPDLYATPKDPARSMAGVTLKVEQGFVGTSEQYEVLWASRLVEKRVPMYWVTPDICEAIAHTTPPMTLDWYNMHLPHEAIVFMLPNGAITHETDGPVRWISFYRARRGEWFKSIADRGPEQWSSENGALCVLSKTDRYLNHWNMPHDAYPVLDLRAIDEALQRHESEVHSSGWLTSPNMDKTDTRCGIKVTHLLFGLLLFMLRKPELVEKETLASRIPPKNGKAAREFWNPAVIGRNYKIKRVVRALGGTHASPRYHWVSGYWKDVHYGPGHQYVKEVLIEPYERGLGEPENE